MFLENNNPFGIIYFCRCLINGKYYVGQTKKTLEHRKKEHLAASRTRRKNKISQKQIFHKAISFYRAENFEWGILKECKTTEMLNHFEVYFIDLCNSYLLDFGYNMTRGGDSNRGYVQTKEVREHHSKMLKGRKRSPNSGWPIGVKRGPQAESTKQKLREYWEDPERKQYLRDLKLGKPKPEGFGEKVKSAWTPERRAAASALFSRLRREGKVISPGPSKKNSHTAPLIIARCDGTILGSGEKS